MAARKPASARSSVSDKLDTMGTDITGTTVPASFRGSMEKVLRIENLADECLKMHSGKDCTVRSPLATQALEAQPSSTCAAMTKILCDLTSSSKLKHKLDEGLTPTCFDRKKLQEIEKALREAADTIDEDVKQLQEHIERLK
ncbi:hypothetical protein MRX96_009512 [Rhipicephalus microplus]